LEYNTSPTETLSHNYSHCLSLLSLPRPRKQIPTLLHQKKKNKKNKFQHLQWFDPSKPKMMHTADSDVTSLDTSSHGSPKPAVYYMQSPLCDSQDDGDKSSSAHATPTFNSPSHPSYGCNSRASSASRFSGTFLSGSGRKPNRKRNDTGWPNCDVIQEEWNYDEPNGDRRGLSRSCQLLIALLGFVVIFSVFCLILWGASRPYNARVSIKVLRKMLYIYTICMLCFGISEAMVMGFLLLNQ
jgi:hypothetical protein